MNSLLAINIGNTNITVGLFENSSCKKTWKIKKDELKKTEEILLENKSVNGVILGSVVPHLTPKVLEILKKLNFPEPLSVSNNLKFNLKIGVENTEQIGADILANLMAANKKYPKPLIVLDCGTATTFCILTEKSEFAGCVIAPGLMLLAKSLSDNTALLPKSEVTKPENIIGKNTKQAMQSGIYFGYIGLITQILKKLKKKLGDVKVVATGGNFSIVSQDIEETDYIDETLTLDGLHTIFELNH